MFAYLFQIMFHFWTESHTHYEAEFDLELWSSGILLLSVGITGMHLSPSYNMLGLNPELPAC